MEKKVSIEPCMDSYLHSAFVEGDIASPEKYLLVAIIERSYRDLLLEDKDHMRAAIMWFKGDTKSDKGFTFKQCLEYLPLSQKHLNEIQRAVQVALTHLSSPSEVREERIVLKNRNNYRCKTY